jgi:tetrapyrrole methylase family protein/MazG family protein
MSNFERLIEIMKKLRAPEGCPWDREQSHQTLIPYLLEETYEVIDSIEDNDMAELKEELGDLLLHVVFHAQIADENGDFNI